MTRFTTLSVLALATSAFAIPQNHGYGHVTLHKTGTSVHPSASGVSHHLPSASKASSVVKPKSKSKSHSKEDKSIETKSHEKSATNDAITASHESVPTAPSYHHDGVSADDSTTCTDQLTVTTKIQVTVTVTEQRYESSGAAASAYNVDHHDNAAPGYGNSIEQSATGKEHSETKKEHTATSKKHHVSASASVSHAKHSSHASSSKRHSSHVSESHKASSEAVKSTESHKASSSESPVHSSESPKPYSPESPKPYSSAEDKHSSSLSPVHSSVPAPVEHTTAPTTSVAAPTSHADVASSPADKAPLPIVTPISIPALAPSSKTSTASTAQASVYTGTGKRGLAYNDAGLLSGFANNPHITWAWNWYSSGSVPAGVRYTPTLWGMKDNFLKVWENDAAKAISAGSTHIFSFNEPDLAAQANLSASAAAAGYKEHISDKFGGAKTKLCSPAVTNGGGNTGLNYLSQFLGNCTSCQIDCINIHWYGTDESDLEKHIDDTIKVAGGREIWLSEFGVNGNPSQDTVDTFLGKALPYLDNKKEVTGYSYFMVDPTIMLSTNKIGATYAGTS